MSFLDTLLGIGSVLVGSQGNRTNTRQNSTQTATGESLSLEQLLTSLTQAVTGRTNEVQNQTASSTGRTTSNEQTTNYGTTNNTGRTTSTESSQTSGTQQQSGVSNTQAVGASMGFEAGLMSQLNQMLGGAVGSDGFGQAQNVMLGQLNRVGGSAGNDFDVDSFVRGVTDSAAARMVGDQESRINQTASAIGGTETGNSMAALLGSRLRNDNMAALAGVEANARAQGEQIRNAGQSAATNQIAALGGQLQGGVQGLISALAGQQRSTQEQQGTTTAATQANTATGTTTGTGTSSTSGTTSNRGTTTGQEVTATSSELDSRTNTTSRTNTSQTQDQTGVTVGSETGATNTASTGSTRERENFLSSLLAALRGSSAAA